MNKYFITIVKTIINITILFLFIAIAIIIIPISCMIKKSYLYDLYQGELFENGSGRVQICHSVAD